MIKMIEDGKITVEEVAPDGSVAKTHELPFGFSMMLPAFRGIAPLRGIDGLVNPRGFVIVNKHQQNPKFANIFSVGVCVAIVAFLVVNWFFTEPVHTLNVSDPERLAELIIFLAVSGTL